MCVSAGSQQTAPCPRSPVGQPTDCLVLFAIVNLAHSAKVTLLSMYHAVLALHLKGITQYSVLLHALNTCCTYCLPQPPLFSLKVKQATKQSVIQIFGNISAGGCNAQLATVGKDCRYNPSGGLQPVPAPERPTLCTGCSHQRQVSALVTSTVMKHGQLIV